jgi:glutamyl-tRNA reductase
MRNDIYLLGLNHKTADVEVREKFALSDCCGREAPPIALKHPLREIMVLSTCNRVEILAVGDCGCKDPDPVSVVLEQWAALRGQDVSELRPYVYAHQGMDAVRHLFCVASSLDSMVVGEPQILGQIKQAYAHSVKQNTTKVILNRLLHKAFSVAKRVRTETDIGSSAVSISYAAVELAKRIFGDMSENAAMLVGAGEMAELAAVHLLNAGVRKIYVANRTYERAVELAAQFKGEALHFESLFDRLADVDIIISSTGAPHAIIRAKDIKGLLKKRKNRPMFFIDIAVPRDIDPDVNNLDNVYLYDIDDLKEVVEENLAQRQEEATRAERIVHDESANFEKWLKSLSLAPTIVDLLRQGEDLAGREVAKTLKRLAPYIPEDANDEVQRSIETMAYSLVRKLYHDPIAFLKRRAEEEESAQRFIEVARRMFNLDQETPPPDAHQDRKRIPSPAQSQE